MVVVLGESGSQLWNAVIKLSRGIEEGLLCQSVYTDG